MKELYFIVVEIKRTAKASKDIEIKRFLGKSSAVRFIFSPACDKYKEMAIREVYLGSD